MLKVCCLGAVVISAGCAGAARNATVPSQSTAAHGVVSTRQVTGKSFLNEPDMTLPVAVGVRMAAGTWKELEARAKPDLVLRPPGYVDGRDLMWVEKGANGELVFRLDRAFVWKPVNGPAMWTLLVQPAGNYREIDLAVELINTPITVTATKPQDDHFPNYAVPLAAERESGTIYEIGWTSWDDRGSGHCNAQRLLYVWQRADGRWQFIGEGEGTGSSHSGREFSGTWVKSTAAFVGNPGVPRIALEVHDVTSENGDEQYGLASLTEQRDYVLTPGENSAAGVPALAGRTVYTEAVEGDTLDTLARRVAMRDLSSGLAYLSPRWHLAEKGSLTDAQAAENADLQREAREMLERMNPGIGARPIKALEKVMVSQAIGL